jgi:23S rRNA (uracil1939-C5)-methyltransferase
LHRFLLVCATRVNRRKSWAQARILRVLAPSPLRIATPCPCFGCCGGCEWQHIDYNAQVDFKTGIVREQLARIGGLVDAEVRSCVASPRVYGYRNRIQLIASANASCRNGGCIHTSWVMRHC